MKKNGIYSTIVILMLTVAINTQAQTYTQLSDLPTLYINTFDGSAIVSKSVYKYAKLIYVYGDSVAQYDSLQIRGRGNSTWTLAKKPYRLKFITKEKFLGKGYAKAKSWTLMANAGDKSLMRNAITSQMGEFLGMKFNPAAKFVDLVLNGTFLGNYQISDQVEVREHRVDIEEQPDTITATSNISGGYLLEVDGFADGNSFRTSVQSIPIRIHYPDEDDIVTSQQNYITSAVNDFETKLFGTSYASATDGYRPLVDSVSLANWYIATEYSANADGFYSIYFYKNRDNNKFYFGPLWDYDIAYANDLRKYDTTKMLMVNDGFGLARAWGKQLWKDPWFQRLILHRWQAVRAAGIEKQMLQYVDSFSTVLDRSQALNYEKWGISTKMYHEWVLYNSYGEYVTDLKKFITNHAAYLDETFLSLQTSDTTVTPIPTPTTSAFKLLPNYYYRIINVGNANALDVVDQATTDGSKICLWANLADRSSEWWIIRAHSDSLYQILNSQSNLALNDPTAGASTATTNIGTQLSLAADDSTNTRQLWQIKAQGTNGYYNIINKYTGHTINVNGGHTDNGTSVLSYTTDSRNATSKNRLWEMMPDEENPNYVPTGIEQAEQTDYILVYNPSARQLRFVTSNGQELSFLATITNLDGKRLASFPASTTFDASSLSAGIYIVHWTYNGKDKSVKMKVN